MSSDATTRLCDLPWRRFRVDTQLDPPLAAPCRNFPLTTNARDFPRLDLELQRLRENLATGHLTGPCLACPDTPVVSVADLHEYLAANGLSEDLNQLLSGIQRLSVADIPTPPAELMNRVANTTSPADFLISGLITVFDLLPLVERYDQSARRRLLDWGSGCGRLSLHIARAFPEIELSGCDIDAEAVEWCRQHLPSGRFYVTEAMPPTSFERRRFTSIVGFSVLTHLSRVHQSAWITELAELLEPGGILVVTVMGETAARRNGCAEELLTRGILDERRDPALQTISPPDYYRSTFQSRRYTEQAWGERFELLEYIEAGAFNYQDIVVMKKRD